MHYRLKGIIKFILLCVVMLAIGFGVLVGAFIYSREKEGISIDKENHLVYRGKISRENFERLRSLYEKAALKPSTLIINSEGGSGQVGIEMGFWIHDNGLSIEVPRYCVSACANYIFTAGKRKVLGKRALLIWHGGAHQSDLFDQIDNVIYGFDRSFYYEAKISEEAKCDSHSTVVECRKKFERILYKFKFLESQFYYELGIDPNLPYYGQHPYYTKNLDIRNYSGFFYSLQNMKAMGIDNVDLKGKYWKPENNWRFREVYEASPSIARSTTDADLGMRAFLEILKDFMALHNDRYFRNKLTNWYVTDLEKTN